jgi:hypothetical protein
MAKTSALDWRFWFRCPSAQQIAAYGEGKLPAAESDAIERHLLHCSGCREQIAMLANLSHQSNETHLPAGLLLRAMTLVPPEGKRSAVKPVWIATAAILVLSAGLGTFLMRSRSAGGQQVIANALPTETQATASPVKPNDGQPATEDIYRGSRNVPHAAGVLSAKISQRGGVTLLRWASVPRAVFYDVTVLSGEGDIVWSTRTEKPAAELPSSALAAGEFARIRAILPAGRSVTSHAVPLK